MAGFGPPPSGRKRRRNADTFDGQGVTVAASDEVRGPELPGADGYLPQTVAWYETWRRAPHAAAFVGTDWQRLAMLAALVDAFFEQPTAKLLGEIRLNEGLLGATHVDRLRARIKVEEPESLEQPAGVADLTSRRRRLTDAS